MSAQPTEGLVSEFVFVLTRLCAVLRPRWLATLTHKQVNLLNEISRSEPVSPCALAETFGVGRPAMSEALRRLKALKLITKEPKPEDRRFMEVRLTAEGDRMRLLPSEVDVENVREFVRWVLTYQGAGPRRLLDRLSAITKAAETALAEARKKKPEPDVAFEAAPPRRDEIVARARVVEEEAARRAREELAKDPELEKLLARMNMADAPPELAPDGSVELEPDEYDEGAFERSKWEDSDDDESAERPPEPSRGFFDEEPVVVVLDDREELTPTPNTTDTESVGGAGEETRTPRETSPTPS